MNYYRHLLLCKFELLKKVHLTNEVLVMVISDMLKQIMVKNSNTLFIKPNKVWVEAGCSKNFSFICSYVLIQNKATQIHSCLVIKLCCLKICRLSKLQEQNSTYSSLAMIAKIFTFFVNSLRYGTLFDFYRPVDPAVTRSSLQREV